VHTQSTRSSESIECGATGGLDDRFDFILVSDNVLSDADSVQYIPGTYWAFGNDTLHYNVSINENPPANISVPDSVLSAIYYMSDHLPVVMDVVVTYPQCGIACTLEASVTDSNDVNCNGGSDGSATVTPSSGTSPYTYQWDANTGNQTDSTATGLSAGTYYVTVTDADGCTANDSVTIDEPPLLVATTTGSVASCPCPCAGSAYVFPTGGTPNYTVDWSNGYGDQFQTVLCDGTYNVTVTDANGCTATGSVTLPLLIP